MYTSAALLDLHERAHRSLQKLMAHCRELSPEELDRELPGFGYPSVRLQLHHEIGAEQYWIGVIQGRIEVDENAAAYPTIEALEAYREQVGSATLEYLEGASAEELNTPREMLTWQGAKRLLTPAHVILRTQTHLYHHQGQIVAMCRLLGKPTGGVDFPIV
jgi:uncharacterized damage-inducible protein DinB